MVLIEAALKSPSIPLYSKGEGSLQETLTPLWKEGKGRFLGGVRGNYVANFWVRTLRDQRMNSQHEIRTAIIKLLEKDGL